MGDSNLELLNKNNAFFRDILFKTLNYEFEKTSGDKEVKLEREKLEKSLRGVLANYFKEEDAVKGVVFTKFDPV
jgi:flagellar basal body-associated protein FliL